LSKEEYKDKVMLRKEEEPNAEEVKIACFLLCCSNP